MHYKKNLMSFVDYTITIIHRLIKNISHCIQNCYEDIYRIKALEVYMDLCFNLYLAPYYKSTATGMDITHIESEYKSRREYYREILCSY